MNRHTMIVIVLIIGVVIAGVYVAPIVFPSLTDRAVEALADYSDVTQEMIADYVEHHSEIVEAWLDDAESLYEAVLLFDLNTTLHDLLFIASDADVALFESVVKIPKNIDNYSWMQPSIDYIDELDRNIPKYSADVISNVIYAIEDKPFLTTNMTETVADIYAFISENIPEIFDQKPMIAIGVAHSVDQWSTDLFYDPEGNLIPKGIDLLLKVLNRHLDRTYGLPMDESFIEIAGENAYLRRSMQIALPLEVFKYNLTDPDSTYGPGRARPSLEKIEYNLTHELEPALSENWTEDAPEEQILLFLKKRLGYNIHPDDIYNKIWPNSIKFSRPYIQLFLNNEEYRPILNIQTNIHIRQQSTGTPEGVYQQAAPAFSFIFGYDLYCVLLDVKGGSRHGQDVAPYTKQDLEYIMDNPDVFLTPEYDKETGIVAPILSTTEGKTLDECYKDSLIIDGYSKRPIQSTN